MLAMRVSPHETTALSGQKRKTADPPAGSRVSLLPEVLRLVEQQSPNISLHEVHNFFANPEISNQYFIENGPETIAGHIALISAAKLLLEVGTCLSPPGRSAAAVDYTPVSSAPHSGHCSDDGADGGSSDVESTSDVETVRHMDSLKAYPERVHGTKVCVMGGRAHAAAGKVKQTRRLVWTDDLHRRFEDAVAKLGSENAKPQAIQQLMNVEGITTRNIKSHLQKYRLRLQKHPSHSSLPSSCQDSPRSAPPRSPVQPLSGRRATEQSQGDVSMAKSDDGPWGSLDLTAAGHGAQ
mmetsp:Transcript_18520/g.62050  ORF Transcript_18520/g.62050 Transcript_18520/m.62050 type:complete len:295 (+) Transcript_18520:114-998(+)